MQIKSVWIASYKAKCEAHFEIVLFGFQNRPFLLTSAANGYLRAALKGNQVAEKAEVGMPTLLETPLLSNPHPFLSCFFCASPTLSPPPLLFLGVPP